MDRQTIIIIIIAASVLFVVFLTYKNLRDKKKVFKPDTGDDTVTEERMEHDNRRDKL